MIIELPLTTFDKIEHQLRKGEVSFHVEDNDFYLTDEFPVPCWVIINQERNYILIKMRKKIKTRRQDDQKKVLLLVNEMNRTFLPNSYYYDDGHIYAESYQYLDRNGSKDKIVELISICTDAFATAIEECDNFGLISQSS